MLIDLYFSSGARLVPIPICLRYAALHVGIGLTYTKLALDSGTSRRASDNGDFYTET